MLPAHAYTGAAINFISRWSGGIKARLRTHGTEEEEEAEHDVVGSCCHRINSCGARCQARCNSKPSSGLVMAACRCACMGQAPTAGLMVSHTTAAAAQQDKMQVAHPLNKCSQPRK